MSHRSFIRKLRELRHCMPPNIIKKMEWTEGMRPLNRNVLAKRHNTAGKVINEMMKYIVHRVADGDICNLPDKNNTMIYMGFNYPLAIEKMQQEEGYLYKEGITPAFIKVSSLKNPRTYLSLLMAKPSREWLIDKVNEGIEYYQPIPLHSTYHLDRKQEEMDAWARLSKEKEWHTLTWTL